MPRSRLAAIRRLIPSVLVLLSILAVLALAGCAGRAPDPGTVLLVRSEADSTATVMLLERENGLWTKRLEVRGHVGANGVTTETREGARKTPQGIFAFRQAFGTADDPGCQAPWLKLTDDDVWVDDPGSVHYNRLVSLKRTRGEWSSAEHLARQAVAYRYAIAIDHNPAAVPGRGSAIFLHCDTDGPTAGCVSVPEDAMREILRRIRRDSLIAIF